MSLSSMASIFAISALTSSFSFSDIIEALRFVAPVALLDAKFPLLGLNNSVSILAKALVGTGEGFDEVVFAKEFLGTDEGSVSPFVITVELLNAFEAGIARGVDFGGLFGPLDSMLEKDMGSDLFMGVFSSRVTVSFQDDSSSIVPWDEGRSPYPFVAPGWSWAPCP